jgi:23S rRNA (uracil1939-C5)-methyltransferase
MTEGEVVEFHIDRIGGRGDGVAKTTEGPVFVPGTVPGDRVRARLGPRRRVGTRAELIEVLASGTGRQEPPCSHFGTCGGCAVQHLEARAYAEWKRGLVIEALARHGLDSIEVAPLVASSPGARRRATLAARRLRHGAVLGFNRRASHRIVDVLACPVMAPAIVSLLPPLRALVAEVLASGAAADLHLTVCDNGLDLLVEAETPLTLERREVLAGFADRFDLARLAWREHGDLDLVAERRTPLVSFGAVKVKPPPGAFLQASAEAEAVLAAEAVAGASAADQVADLFAGCGTFALRLAAGARVHAVDGDEHMLAALQAAANLSTELKPVSIEARDLFRQPLRADELSSYGAVVFDPPRAGAKAQAQELARSAVPTVIAVSCDPATFARDARILVDGGYRLDRVVPVDQFLWSPRIELVALLKRETLA